MSAYVVDDVTINRILAGVRELHAMPMSCSYYPFDDAGYDIRSEDGIRRLGAAMWNLNVRSVRERYEDFGLIDSLPGTSGRVEFTYERLPYDMRQAVESLRCWSYQSCEGGCSEDPLYQLIDRDLRIELLEALVDRYVPGPT